MPPPRCFVFASIFTPTAVSVLVACARTGFINYLAADSHGLPLGSTCRYGSCGLAARQTTISPPHAQRFCQNLLLRLSLVECVRHSEGARCFYSSLLLGLSVLDSRLRERRRPFPSHDALGCHVSNLPLRVVITYWVATTEIITSCVLAGIPPVVF